MAGRVFVFSTENQRNMYDNIKLSLQVDFSETVRNDFCARFGLSTKNEKLKIWHNANEKNLSQHKGIYLHLKNSTLTIRFSLHKVFNFFDCGKQFNYNDFDFAQARSVVVRLADLFSPYFDITQAVVKQYEVGINVITSESPDLYLSELKHIKVGAKVVNVEKDINYKENKQRGTHRDKAKRVVYVFYNKTFEVRSKLKKRADKMNVPENILRVEKDNKRPFEKIIFSQLFESAFVWHTISEFKQRFVSDLIYKETPVKPQTMKKSDFDLCKKILEIGLIEVKREYENEYKTGKTARATYYRHLKKLEQLNPQTLEFEKEISERAKELKSLIVSKLNEVSKMTQFSE